MMRRMKDIDSNQDVLYYYMEVLNPLSYLDGVIFNPSKENVAAKAEHAAVAGGIFGTASFIMYAISGGGAGPMWFNTLRPGVREVWAVKQHSYKTVARSVAHRVPAAATGAAYVYGVHELGTTMTGNIGMETVEHVPGAVTHPFEGGSDEVYYPGKSIVDWVLSW